LQVRLKLVFQEEKAPCLLDMSSLLYDFELLHDLTLMLCAEDYSDYHFSRFFWFRKGRPIKPEHKVRASRIVKESPLVIVVNVADVVLWSGALWALIQAIDKIGKWRLDRKKLRLEIEKLELENRMLKIDLEQKIKQKNASDVLHVLVNRLGDNPIVLQDIEIQVEKSNVNNERVNFT